MAAGWAQAQNSLTNLGGLNRDAYSLATDVSTDGLVVVGYADAFPGYGNLAFRWTPGGGMVSLGTLNGGDFSEAYGVNANGSVVVGSAIDGAAGNAQRAFRWTQDGGMVSLGTLNGGPASAAYGVSANGSVVVGGARDGAAGNAYRAFRWTQGGGMVSLGTLNGFDTSSASAVSANGSVVVGVANDSAVGNARAFRWTQGGGMVSLGTLNGGNGSGASGVSADGSVVVGSATDGAVQNGYRAFRWTEGSGMVSLGALNGANFSYASGVSANGLVVVGAAYDGAAGNVSRAFRWTQATGMQTVEAWLRVNGVTVPADITASASATNIDGSVVVGWLDDAKGFIARVGVAGSGLITLADMQNSLATGVTGSTLALSAANMALSGAHGAPLMRRVEAGKKAFWVAGDWGRDDHDMRSGSFGLAEVGGGLHLGPTQVNLALGQTWARQSLAFNGRAQSEGSYLLAEALTPLAANDDGGLWSTVGGYLHRGQADLQRGYFNAGMQNVSSGQPDTATWGLRARLDWLALASPAGVSLSPYADLTYASSRMGAYTESGGAFPARFDARTDKSTELHLGVNASRPLGMDNATVFGVAEAAHRFEKTTTSTTGEVIGLFGFDLPGQANKQDWLRLAAGVDGKLAGGRASLTLNATTRGPALSTWLAANWQTAF